MEQLTARDILEGEGTRRAYNPELMATIGINETLFLMQLQYWISKKEEQKEECTTIKDGYVWVFNSLNKWAEQFPMFSSKTLQRAIKNLRDRNLIITENHNRKGYDRTAWYRINYDELAKIDCTFPNQKDEMSKRTNCPSGKEREEEKEENDIPKRTDCPNPNGQNDHIHMDKMTSPIPIDYYKDFSKDFSNIHGAFSERNALDADNDDSYLDYDILDVYDYQKLLRYCQNAYYELYQGNKMDDFSDTFRVIRYFFNKYYVYRHIPHPMIITSKMIEQLHEENFDSNGRCEYIPFDRDTYFGLIDQYFETDFTQDCDYNINHFLSGDVRLFRYYEI